MRRVCIVNPFEHGGGAEYQISLLIEALADSGHEVHYLTHFVQEGRAARRYRVWRIGHGPIPRFGYLVESPDLYRTLARLRPHVIYQRSGGAYTGICAAFSRRRRVPMVWHVCHDAELTPGEYEGGRNVVRTRLEKWALEYGVRHATTIVCQTQRQAELLRENYGREAAEVIGNFHPPAAGKIDKSGPLAVVWIANFKPWKRPEAFVRLAERFKGEPAVRFYMVGLPPSPSGHDRWRETLMAGMAAAQNLEYLGHLTQDQVNDVLDRAHIFVNTSKFEGFPNTFIQAWLRHAAVLSLTVDPDDVLARREVGIIAGTEEGLYQGLRRLVDHPQERLRLAERGRAHAQAHHSIANAERLVRLIDAQGGLRLSDGDGDHRG